MGLELDILVIIILAVFVVIGFRNGIARTVVSVVGTLIASALSMFLANPVAEGIYNGVIKTSLTEKIEDAMKMSSQTGSGNLIDNILNTMPDFVNRSLFNFGISTKEFSTAISHGASAIEELLSSIIISFISVFVSLFLFIILMVIIKLVSKMIVAAIDDSAIGTVNRFLGALIGLVEGFVVVIVIAFVIRIAVPHFEKTPKIISEESISQSTVFKGIYDSPMLAQFIADNTMSPNPGSVNN